MTGNDDRLIGWRATPLRPAPWSKLSAIQQIHCVSARLRSLSAARTFITHQRSVIKDPPKKDPIMPNENVTATIDAGIRSFKKDFEPVRGRLAERDANALRDNLEAAGEALAECFNFEAYRRSLQAVKAEQDGRLRPETEAAYLGRLQAAIHTYGAMNAALERLVAGFNTAGLARPFEAHSKDLFWQFPHSPLAPRIVDRFRRMGATDVDIADITNWVKFNNWDPLHARGADGTLNSLVRLAAGERVPTLQKMLSVERTNGLPVIDGACDSGTWSTIIFIAGCIIICFIFGCEVIVTA